MVWKSFAQKSVGFVSNVTDYRENTITKEQFMEWTKSGGWWICRGMDTRRRTRRRSSDGTRSQRITSCAGKISRGCFCWWTRACRRRRTTSDTRIGSSNTRRRSRSCSRSVIETNPGCRAWMKTKRRCGASWTRSGIACRRCADWVDLCGQRFLTERCWW